MSFVISLLAACQHPVNRLVVLPRRLLTTKKQRWRTPCGRSPPIGLLTGADPSKSMPLTCRLLCRRRQGGEFGVMGKIADCRAEQCLDAHVLPAAAEPKSTEGSEPVRPASPA